MNKSTNVFDLTGRYSTVLRSMFCIRRTKNVRALDNNLDILNYVFLSRRIRYNELVPRSLVKVASIQPRCSTARHRCILIDCF